MRGKPADEFREILAMGQVKRGRLEIAAPWECLIGWDHRLEAAQLTHSLVSGRIFNRSGSMG